MHDLAQAEQKSAQGRIYAGTSAEIRKALVQRTFPITFCLMSLKHKQVTFRERDPAVPQTRDRRLTDTEDRLELGAAVAATLDAIRKRFCIGQSMHIA